MELADYWRALRHHWMGVALIVVATIVVGLAFSLSQPKTYSANASGFVTAGASSNPSEAAVGDSVAKSRAASYVKVAQSRAVAHRVIDDLSLDGASPESLTSRIKVTQPVDTVLIEIAARDSDPAQAERLANAWIAALADEVASIEGGGADTSLRIAEIEAAEQPKAPVSPDIPRNIWLSALIGGALAMIYAAVRSQLDRKLRRPEDIERGFDVPVLASVPQDDALADSANAHGLIMLGSDDSLGANRAHESFLRMRTNLQFANVDDPPQVVVVTSPLPGDGKSTVAANLAAAIAVNGRQVVLIDGDLRRPVVAERYGAVEGAGLTDVLVGRVTMDDVLQPTKIPGLSILGAGSRPPNPSELLGTDSMKSVLDSLREDHVVIIDAPPIIPVTDVAVLSSATDGVIIVAAANKTIDSQLSQSLESIRRVGGTILGVVVNKAKLRRASRDYYAGYYAAETSYRPFDDVEYEPTLEPTVGKRRRSVN